MREVLEAHRLLKLATAKAQDNAIEDALKYLRLGRQKLIRALRVTGLEYIHVETLLADAEELIIEAVGRCPYGDRLEQAIRIIGQVIAMTS